jgi:radical SAM protein with 4Fe4S-binding SPASM domain
MFHKIYIEITNECGLSCSFCPNGKLPANKMSLELFEKIVAEASEYTKLIACHVMGDPLTVNNLSQYLDVIEKYGLQAELTTSGYFIRKQDVKTLLRSCVKQINISLNSYNKNSSSITLEQYLKPILELCGEKQRLNRELFINLRLWNLDELMSERDFNSEIFKRFSQHFGIELDIEDIYKSRPKSIRLEYKTLLHFDNYFEWPSLDNRVYGDGTCHGLSSHIAILSSGRVVPCCLDGEGIINLGDLNSESLRTILNSKRAVAIKESFQKGIAKEELCQKCSYKSRFTQ